MRQNLLGIRLLCRDNLTILAMETFASAGFLIRIGSPGTNDKAQGERVLISEQTMSSLSRKMAFKGQRKQLRFVTVGADSVS
jgi:hypothetical protein